MNNMNNCQILSKYTVILLEKAMAAMAPLLLGARAPRCGCSHGLHHDSPQLWSWHVLVTWWLVSKTPLKKYEFVSWDDDAHIWKNSKSM